MDPLVLFFKQQLDRITKNKPNAHAPGPRKPNLAQLDLGLKPIPGKTQNANKTR